MLHASADRRALRRESQRCSIAQERRHGDEAAQGAGYIALRSRSYKPRWKSCTTRRAKWPGATRFRNYVLQPYIACQIRAHRRADAMQVGNVCLDGEIDRLYPVRAFASRKPRRRTRARRHKTFPCRKRDLSFRENDKSRFYRWLFSGTRARHARVGFVFPSLPFRCGPTSTARVFRVIDVTNGAAVRQTHCATIGCSGCRLPRQSLPVASHPTTRLLPFSGTST